MIDATIDEIHTAYDTGGLSAVELVEWYLERIDAYDDDLNAILTINPAARDRARELDAAFEDDGLVGPLHGIPIVLKDNQATHDLPTTAGSEALANSVPPRDAFLVERLRDAGGIVLAKANLQEFSFGVDTVSSLGGETRNAYSLNHRPSGSSGGTAAAIAANLGAVGTGSDTCSSVRSPPAFNSAVGMRPTRGLVSRTGVVPLSESQDTAGPITRTVADAARMLDVMADYDSEDPITATGVGEQPENGYAAHLDQEGLEGARIGVVREFFGLRDETLNLDAEAETVTEVIDDAIEEMAAAGATIVDPVSVPDAASLEEARLTDLEFKRDLEAYLDAFTDDAAYASLEAIVDSGEVHPWVRERIEGMGMLDVDSDSLDENVDYLRRLARRTALEVKTVARMADDDLDALLYPPSSVPPVEIPNRQPFSELRCELAAHTGLPAIVVPAGFTPDGLPVGVELLGRPFAEPRLVELAYAYERATRHRVPPARFGPVT